MNSEDIRLARLLKNLRFYLKDSAAFSGPIGNVTEITQAITAQPNDPANVIRVEFAEGQAVDPNRFGNPELLDIQLTAIDDGVIALVSYFTNALSKVQKDAMSEASASGNRTNGLFKATLEFAITPSSFTEVADLREAIEDANITEPWVALAGAYIDSRSMHIYADALASVGETHPMSLG